MADSLLALSGLLVALTIRTLPGTAGHKPVEGSKTAGAVQPIELPGIILAAFATLSLSGFRGGPAFPGMFIGAVGGIALASLPGLPMIAGAAMGVGAMTCAMLGLPLVSVLLVTLFLQADGLPLMPLVIVAVVVAYVVSARLAPTPVPVEA